MMIASTSFKTLTLWVVAFLFLVEIPIIVTGSTHNSSGYLSKRDTTPDIECSNGEYVQMIWDGFYDAISAARATLAQLTVLKTFLASEPNRNEANTQQEMIMETFEAVYGEILAGQGDPNAESVNAYGRIKVNNVFLIASSMALVNTIYLPRYYHIFCDENFWIPVEPNAGQDMRLDGRPLQDGGGTEIDFSEGTCGQGTTAYTWSHPTAQHDMTCFCPQKLEEFEETRLSNMLDYDWVSIGSDLDFVATEYFATTVIHELTHLKWVYGSSVLEDIPCSDNPLDSYGWACVTQHAAQNPDLALKNADNFALFATAMYLGNTDWRNGNANPYTP